MLKTWYKAFLLSVEVTENIWEQYIVISTYFVQDTQRALKSSPPRRKTSCRRTVGTFSEMPGKRSNRGGDQKGLFLV
jgi:hypothetical protein